MEFTIWKPPADVLHRGERWLVKMDVAGVRPEELEIAARGNSLRIRGCRRDMLLEQGYFYHSLEIGYCRFERVIDFPHAIDADSVRWHYRDGMLLVQLKLLIQDRDRAL
ncbi:Hsp20/alpha crystallin family protein [Gilvimarinus sp. F26214L]|uniref:Hsp20/alpha crystallin family protein n=1 Tax=Gilvimarinus sp. DZF01 TaxID=3461371 RepID=UPI004045937A